jgi:hypothetical protein
LACVLRSTVKEPVRGCLDDRAAPSHGQVIKNMLEFACDGTLRVGLPWGLVTTPPFLTVPT